MAQSSVNQNKESEVALALLPEAEEDKGTLTVEMRGKARKWQFPAH
jgi:hypothetical protein